MPDVNSSKPHWTKIKFGDVVRLSKERSSDPLADGYERFIGLEHIDPEDLRIRRWGNVADGVTFTNVFKPGQVLFGKRRAYQRKVAVADFAGVCSGDIYVLESKDPKILLPELLPFICQTESFFQHAVGTSAGSLSPRTNWTSLAEFEFALPPLEEQQYITELLSSSEKVLEALKATEQAISKVRASLGVELFAQPSKHSLTPCSSLIASGDLSLQTGPFGTVLKASAYKDFGCPVINPVNMNDGVLNIEDGPFIGEEDRARLEKYTMKTGDMVMGRKGDMSNLIFVQPEYNGFIVGSDCIRFRVNPEKLHQRYFFNFLRSETTNHWIQGQAYGTVMPGINEKILGRLLAYIPSISEQEQIASEFDRLEVALSQVKGRFKDSLAFKKTLLNGTLWSDPHV